MCRRMLESVVGCWKVSDYARECRRMLKCAEDAGCVRGCWSVGECWKVLKDAGSIGGCWKVSEDAGVCQRMLESVGGCWRVSEDARVC